MGSFAHALADAGVPAGVVNIVVGRGVDCGARLSGHPDVSMVSFTGSTATGRRVMAAAALTAKRVHLELGGRAPFVVFDDADLPAAIHGAVAGRSTTPTGTRSPPWWTVPGRSAGWSSAATHLANATEYGLAASAWTRDVYRSLRATREIQAGCVWVNDHIPIVSEMPHGGYQRSGFGKDMSAYSFEEYTNVKHVMQDLTAIAEKPWHRTIFRLR